MTAGGISQTKYTSQAIHNMSFDDGLKVQVTELIGADGILKNPATSEKQDSIVSAIQTLSVSGMAFLAAKKATDVYGYQAKSTTATYIYFFFEDGAGNWYITRKTIATGVFAFAKGIGGYTSVYVDSTSAPSGSPTFGTYNETFDSVTSGAGSIDNLVDILTDNSQKTQIVNSTGTSATVEARKQTPTGNALNVQIGPGDPISNVPVVMDYEHHQVHEGETYKSIDQQLSLGTNTVKYGITVATYANTIQAPHMVVEADVYNGSARVDVYETATFTGGSSLTAYNRNRNATTTPNSSVKTGVTSTNGTLIDSFFCGAGTRTAGQNRQQSEWILKSNTIYRMDVVGLVANTQAIVSFNWYEDLGV